MIRTLYRTPEGELRWDLKPEDFPSALNTPDGVLWVDFENTPAQEDEPILLQAFRFHPLAVDDALRESHAPKVEDWDSYLYLVLHAIAFGRNHDGKLETDEVDVFLGRNYIVTHHDQPVAAIHHVWDCCRRDERYLSRGTDHILYRLVDDMVAAYMPAVEEIDEAIEAQENEIFDHPTPANLAELFKLKRALLQLRRIIAPQREVLNKLARDDYPVIDAKDRIFFRDVYDHLVRLHDINESMRDLVGGALDTYLSVINNRMNDIMKTLTVITTLFMPMSFVAGFFGMNFFLPAGPQLGSIISPLGFLITLAVMLALPILMILLLRKNGWM
ncbi:MAG: magnesium/cobalt transporter CorA [Anaerolineales bacterium]|nr:magnesium/cobalt transporter CorA [Anaerolineales bacterium]